MVMWRVHSNSNTKKAETSNKMYTEFGIKKSNLFEFP